MEGRLNRTFGVFLAQVLFFVAIQVPAMIAVWSNVYDFNIRVVVYLCPKLGIAQRRNSGHSLLTIGTVSLESHAPDITTVEVDAIRCPALPSPGMTKSVEYSDRSV